MSWPSFSPAHVKGDSSYRVHARRGSLRLRLNRNQDQTLKPRAPESGGDVAVKALAEDLEGWSRLTGHDAADTVQWTGPIESQLSLLLPMPVRAGPGRRTRPVSPRRRSVTPLSFRRQRLPYDRATTGVAAFRDEYQQ
jgi:hypothetical protein